MSRLERTERTCIRSRPSALSEPRRRADKACQSPEVKACSASQSPKPTPALIERTLSRSRQADPETKSRLPVRPVPLGRRQGGDVLTDPTRASGPTRFASRPRRSLGLSHHPVIGQTDLQPGKRHDCAMNQTRLSCQLERAHLKHTCSVLGLVTFGGPSRIDVQAVGHCIVSAVRCRTPETLSSSTINLDSTIR